MLHRTIAIGTLVLAVAAVLLVPIAAADKPIKEPLPLEDVTGQFCEDFPVLLHVTTNKEFIKIFSSGAALVTGALKTDATNLVTGKTLHLNISGPGKVSADGSTLIGTGRILLFGEAGDLGPGSGPEITLISGKVVVTFGPEGITSLTRQGHFEDICAALAA